MKVRIAGVVGLGLPRSEELVIARMQVEGELRSLTGPNAVDLVRASGDVFASARTGAPWSASC